MLNPVQNGREHVFLGRDVQLAVGNELFDFLKGQKEELLGGHHLLEILQGVDVRLEVQLFAAVSIGKTSYSEAVGRMQLPQEEFAAGFAHFLHLQDAAGGQEDLNVVRCYDDLAGVGVLDEEIDGRGVQVVDGNFGLAVFFHVA